jgi:hypothetical protein
VEGKLTFFGSFLAKIGATNAQKVSNNYCHFRYKLLIANSPDSYRESNKSEQ